MDVATQVLVIVLLTIVGGLFAASEMALVSLREGQVKALSHRGRRGARLASLVSDPTTYLATIQIGVTLAGFFSAAFGAQALSQPVGDWLVDLGMARSAAEPTAFLGVTLIITYVSLVFAELVPKRLAQQHASSFALAVARPIGVVSLVFKPLVAFLSFSTNLVVRLFGGGREAPSGMTHAELRSLLLTEGVLSADERHLIDEVFGAGGLQVREVMRPRTEVTFVPAGLPVRRVLPLMVSARYSRYPVMRRDADDLVGFLHVRDVAAAALRQEGSRPVGELAREVLRVPGTKPVLAALAEMRQRSAHLAIVVDEYGGTAGIVTLEDLIEEVVGDITDEYDREVASYRRVDGGAVELDGLSNREDLGERTGLRLPEGPYETLAGFVMATLGRIPQVGDTVTVDDRRVEVVAMDGRRVELLRLHPPAKREGVAAGPAEPPSPGTLGA